MPLNVAEQRQFKHLPRWIASIVRNLGARFFRLARLGMDRLPVLREGLDMGKRGLAITGSVQTSEIAKLTKHRHTPVDVPRRIPF